MHAASSATYDTGVVLCQVTRRQAKSLQDKRQLLADILVWSEALQKADRDTAKCVAMALPGQASTQAMAYVVWLSCGLAPACQVPQSYCNACMHHAISPPCIAPCNACDTAACIYAFCCPFSARAAHMALQYLLAMCGAVCLRRVH